MFVTLKTLLRTLLLPPAGPLLLAFAGVWLLGRGAAARRLGFALLAAGLGSLWVLSTPAVADRLAHAAEREPALDITRLPEAQAIVILGGSGERHAAPEYAGLPAAGGDLLERLAYGAYVARVLSLEQERMKTLGGGLRLESTPDHDTLVTAYCTCLGIGTSETTAEPAGEDAPHTGSRNVAP